MNDKITTENGAAITAGMELADPKPFDILGVPALLIPSGMALKTFPEHMRTPLRIEQRVVTHTPGSFLDYLERFDESFTTVFCDAASAKFTAILDYHHAEPGWCKHVVSYTCKKTQEWAAWLEKNVVQMDQLEFAYFIEQNLDDIREPAAGQMLEIALTLKACTSTVFESGKRLQDGQVQFVYREDIKSGAGEKGDIKIPEKITLGIRLFEGGEAYQIEARFRYRIADGKVRMWYDLIRPHKAHEAAINDVLAHIKTNARAELFIEGVI